MKFREKESIIIIETGEIGKVLDIDVTEFDDEPYLIIRPHHEHFVAWYSEDELRKLSKIERILYDIK